MTLFAFIENSICSLWEIEKLCRNNIRYMYLLEGTFGILKWDKSYKRLFRRDEQNVILELTLISCGFNLYKYHNKKQRQMKVT